MNYIKTRKEFTKCTPKGLLKYVSIIAVGCNTSFVNDATSFSIKHILKKKDYNRVLDRVIGEPLTMVKKLLDEISIKTILQAREEIKNK